MMYQDQWHFNKGELDVAPLSPGDVGELTITVEVMGVDKDGVTVMKHGPVRVTKPFKEMDLGQLRDKIGVVEDEESPMHKETKGDE